MMARERPPLIPPLTPNGAAVQADKSPSFPPDEASDLAAFVAIARLGDLSANLVMLAESVGTGDCGLD